MSPHPPQPDPHDDLRPRVEKLEELTMFADHQSGELQRHYLEMNKQLLELMKKLDGLERRITDLTAPKAESDDNQPE